MNIGTRYRTIEEVVAILEEHLSIAMKKEDDGETGISYDWATDPDEFGISYCGIYVQPTRVFDAEEQKMQWYNTNWKQFTFVIGVSDELTPHIARIRELIRQGLLVAEEIPFPVLT